MVYPSQADRLPVVAGDCQATAVECDTDGFVRAVGDSNDTSNPTVVLDRRRHQIFAIGEDGQRTPRLARCQFVRRSVPKLTAIPHLDSDLSRGVVSVIHSEVFTAPSPLPARVSSTETHRHLSGSATALSSSAVPPRRRLSLLPVSVVVAAGFGAVLGPKPVTVGTPVSTIRQRRLDVCRAIDGC